MPIDIYSPTVADTLDLVELDLYHSIMQYRAGLGLPSIPLSNGLTATAGRHSLDQYYNIELTGDGRPAGANLHSWSDRPYMSNGSTQGAMWNAPSRLGTSYPEYGFEISAAGQPNGAAALQAWKTSFNHDIVMRNAGVWSGFNWGAIGIGIESNPRADSGPIRFGDYYNVWFGVQPDPSGGPLIVGTAGHDDVRTTEFDDRIAAGAGNDSVRARDGDDIIHLGQGANWIHGGAGTDRVVVNAASSQADLVWVNGGWQITVNGRTSMLRSVEQLTFSDGTFAPTENGLERIIIRPPEPPQETPTTVVGPPMRDLDPSSDDLLSLPPASAGGTSGVTGMAESGAGRRVIGDDSDNMIGGPGTDDTLNGGGGDDSISGGNGYDMLAGGSGNDTVTGGNGNDNIGGGTGHDIVSGGAGNDTLGAGRGNDTVNGGLEHDVMAGGAGDDVMFGEAGNDTMGGGYGDDTVSGGNGNDNLGGGDGRDILHGHEGADRIGGGEGDDLIHGGGGNDFLAGGGRDDTIIGGAGSDTINGGLGDDEMFGDGGADLFVFNEYTSGEVDVIGDFEEGVDQIRLVGIDNAPGSGIDGKIDALGITATTVDGVGGTMLSYEGHVIKIAGVAATSLDADDFVFV